MTLPDKAISPGSASSGDGLPGGGPVRHFAFLLLPDFSMIALSSAIEPLRMANRLRGVPCYRWTLMSVDGLPVCASNGIEFRPDAALGAAPDVDVLFVCGGVGVEQAWNETLRAALLRLARRNISLGALCTGSYVLGRAGLLNGYRSAIHWENTVSLREMFPGVVVTDELFEVDRDRYTSSGGTAPLDMMLHLIGRDHGGDLAVAISEEFLCERIRGPHEQQRVPLQQRFGRLQPTLSESVALMEANIEEPLSIDELASHVGVSRRQLERLFRKYLDTVPARYYLQLRLRHAQHLLLQTSMSVSHIAVACGFASTQHFSTCYRERFGMSPRAQRIQVWPMLRPAPHATARAATLASPATT